MAILKFKNSSGVWEALESVGAVQYLEQTLSESEQTQARVNIGANQVLVETLFSGNATSATISSDKAWKDYDIVIVCWNGNSGAPSEATAYSPKYGPAVSIVNIIDLTGTECRGSVQGFMSTTLGGTVTVTTLTTS